MIYIFYSFLVTNANVLVLSSTSGESTEKDISRVN